MNAKGFIITSVMFVLGLGSKIQAQGDFYSISKIQKIEIQFAQSNWDYILDTNKYGNDAYILAQSVMVNGVILDSVGVKYKGSSSYDSTYKKNPLHLKLDKFKNNDYKGITDIKLANIYSDPSMIREVLAYSISNKYMHSSHANFAMVFINGRYYGLYSNDEVISKTFCSSHFYSDASNPMFKCSQLVASPYSKSSLKYISKDSLDYFPRYEMESKIGWVDFIALCDTVTNYQSRITANIDVDRFLWMFAFNNALINLDSYSGAFSQNYYVFKDNTKHYNPIAWDLNMSFGAFPYAGSQGGGLGTLTVAQMQNLTALLHSNDADWPLMNSLLSDISYKKRYLAHLKTILDENFVNSNYDTIATQLQSLVDSAVKADTCKFFSYSQFQNGMNGNVVFGSRTIPGLRNLMDTRTSFLLANELSISQPLILNTSTSVSNPALGSIFSFKATIQNSNLAYLYFRFSETQKFTKIQLFDDGAHNDGAANDMLFGASITMSSGLCQYYYYAENANGAMLSPQRAEHEFYTVSSASTKVNLGDVRINEFMASNLAAVKDSAGDYDDWIEIFNNTSNPVDFTGWYLSDDTKNITKWRFPNGIVIAPKGYFIVWCDNQINQVGIHSTFKLSNNGEAIILSQIDSTIVDSVTFGMQRTDTSFARIPNGVGTFQFRQPTFNNRNDTAAIGIKISNNIAKRSLVYPNPCSGLFEIITSGDFQAIIYDVTGRELFRTNSTKVNLIPFGNGSYYIAIIKDSQLTETQKVIVIK